nr:unnamed protein product [Callosobruchus analis]
MIAVDERGRHGNHSRVPEFIKQGIREHIMQILAMESHYSRERSQRKYFGSHLNLSRLYRLYRDYCEEKNIPEQHIAKEWLYTEVFNKEFNISFKYPSNDTCNLCDSYLIRLKDESNAEERETFNVSTRIILQKLQNVISSRRLIKKNVQNILLDHVNCRLTKMSAYAIID